MGDVSDHIWALDAVLTARGLPFSLKLLLENLLRHEDGDSVTAESIERLASGAGTGDAVVRPARVFLHETNGIRVLWISRRCERPSVLWVGTRPE